MITALTTATRAVCHSTLDDAGIQIEAFSLALVHHISTSPTRLLPESLCAGLLDILLLRDVLFPATVYDSVLVQLKAFLPQVRNRDAAAIFGDVALLAHWESFVDVIESRFRSSSNTTLGPPEAEFEFGCAGLDGLTCGLASLTPSFLTALYTISHHHQSLLVVLLLPTTA
ncbi:hypothetical protein C8R45DRAFT_1099327 [Mycena sanguinolenta]|nr:hypothetical protein C8R45DRAFT_1099327 [Mycena sanguinolenta]